jgi:subtilase family serine protease
MVNLVQGCIWLAIGRRTRRNLVAELVSNIIMCHVGKSRKPPQLAGGGVLPWWCALGAVLLFLPHAALAQRQVLSGHVPAAVAGLPPLGDLDQSKPMEVLIGLPLRHRPRLTNLLEDLYNPASPSYHQYLTPAQFTEKFSPTTEDYQSVIAFAKSNGLTVGEMFANRTLLQVHGTVADMERVFQVRLRVYQHPTEGRTFFAPDGEPSVDLPVPLLAITGLDSFVLPHPLNLRAGRSHPARPMTGSAPSGNYWGNDFRAAYVPGTSLTGAGQKVGLFELDGYYPSDIASYESQASLPSVPLSNFLLDGASGSAGSADDEVSLDIEMAISMAPGLSGVIVYEGPNENNITAANVVLNCMATNDAAKQLSCSWGFSINASTVATFQQFGTQGQSFFLASGDSGAFTGAAPAPSDDPYITVVGGTTLTTSGPGGAWVSEEVWNWFTSREGSGASTGGISATYTNPPWQSAVSMALNQGSTAYRNIPDVALTADNVWVLYDDGGSGEFGGTSCAAPLWAGFTALVNQQAAQNQRSPAGFLNPALYALGLGSSYAFTFHDITAGNNTNATVRTKFLAEPGYDLCTGWGTPNGTNLINALAPSSTSPVVTATATLVAESCLPTNGAIDPGETVTLNLTLTNSSPAATTNLVATLQAGSAVLLPTGPQTYGALAQGQAAVALPFTFTAGGTCGQTISLVWQLEDGTDNLGSVSLNFNLGALVSATTLSQNFDGVTAPALPTGWSTSVTGEQVDWFTTTAANDSAPNSAFATDVANPGVAYLLSPVFPIVSRDAQLTFRQNYYLEYEKFLGTTYYYDGGVLDIAIGSGSFSDIISAGGSFVTGAYNGTIYASSGNPRAGSSAWGGNSGGWITTTINLPAAAAGQNVQLRWGCATDTANDSTVVGWYVDTISLQDAYYSCCVSAVLPPAIVPGSVNLTTNGGLSLSVNSMLGVTYSLEYKNYLTDAAWTILPASTMTGTGGVITLQDTGAPQAQRFYRVMASY